MQKGGFVYIMTNQLDEVLYIGVTNNIYKRVYQHKNHIYEGFTDKYNCEKLVYFEIGYSINICIKREKQLKRWHRQWKINLINEFNPRWEDLSAAWYETKKITNDNLFERVAIIEDNYEY